MNSDQEQAIERLLTLLDNDNLDIDAAIAQFRGERRAKRQEHEAQLRSAQASYEYRVTIPGNAQFRTTGDTLGVGPRDNDWYPLRYDEIDNFCKRFGLKRGALMDVLEGRALEVAGHGIAFRLYNSPYVDRSAKRQEQEAYRIEDERYAIQLAKRAKERANIPTAFPMPVSRSWKDI